MRFVVAVLLALTVFLTGSRSEAQGKPRCLAGAELKGPNCVQVMHVEPTEFSAHETVLIVSWVYRLVNGIPVTVWRGAGQVKASTKEKLRIYVWFIAKSDEDEDGPKPEIEYEYDVFWDGRAYSVRGF